MKYIMTKHLEPIIFPDSIQHDTFEFLQPISAGFVSIMDGKVSIYGESVTLRLKNDISDKFIIEKLLEKG